MKYKVLTLTQPWATLVAIGAKKIETRSWNTSYRGELLIHAAAGFGKGGMRKHKELCGTEPFCAVLNAAMRAWDTPPKSLKEMAEHPFMPMGAIVAVCELIDCVPTQHPGIVSKPGTPWFTGARKGVGQHYYEVPPPLDSNEFAFGDYTPGRFAWPLATVQPLPRPIPAKGALGLWEWEGDIGL